MSSWLAGWLGATSNEQCEAGAYVSVTPEMLQQLDFAQGALGQNLLAKDIGDFLDGNSLVGLVIDGSTIHNRIEISIRSCS